MEEQKEDAYIELMHWGKRVKITFDHHDLDIYEAVDTFKYVLLGAGFQESLVNKLTFSEDGEQIDI